MPSTTESGLIVKNTKISAAKLMGREEGSTSLFSAKGKGPVGANAPVILDNKKAIAINARKITSLKNIVKGRGEKIWKGESIGEKLPGSGGSLKSILGEVASSMDGIRDTLIEKNKVDADEAEDDRKEKEKAARKTKEKDLEGKFQGIKKVADKVLAPVKSIWETIMNFVTTVILGKIGLKLFAWFSDKKNEKKVKAIGRFFKDFWPLLLGGYLAFGTAIGKFVAGLAAKIVLWGAAIVAKAIPALIAAAKAMGPWGLAALAALGIGAGAMYMANRNENQRDKDNRKDDASTVTPKEFSESRKDNDKSNDQTPSAAQAMNEYVGQRGMGGAFNKGGQVPGRGPNKDTVPAMLTPGEFVMSKGAVQKWGVDTFAGMNAAGGVTNKIKKDKDGVTYANAGGLIGGIKNMVAGLFGGKKDKVQEGSLQGLTASDYKDLAYIVSGEAQRGTADEYGVAAAVLNRVADPAWPSTIKAVGNQEGQFEAVYTGKAYDDPALAAKLSSPAGQSGILSALQTLHGRTDFKGTSQYKNMGKGDVKFSPRGNFYHYKEQIGKSDPPPKSIPTHWKKFVGTGASVGDTSSTPRTGGGGGSISAPPGAPPPLPPVKPTSTVAYANQKSKQQGKSLMLEVSQSLPHFDAGTMVSSDKIKVLGISV